MWERGRVLTNDTWLPDDPVGLRAGMAPETVPAATWNCPLPSHISLSRLTLVFCIAQEHTQRLQSISRKHILSATLPFYPPFIKELFNWRLFTAAGAFIAASQGNSVSVDFLCHVSHSGVSVKLYFGMEGIYQQSTSMWGATFRFNLWLEIYLSKVS